MLVLLVIGASYFAVLKGAAGEGAAVIVTWAAMGSLVASALSLLVDWRAKRRGRLNPWTPPPPTVGPRYAIVGGCVGAVFAVAALVLDSWLLA